jgi:sodium-coupled neutral amino acid transporter 11
MKSPSINNWKIVTHSSVFISIGFSLLFGMVGYLSFNNLTQGDIFENYCHNDDLINVVRLFYSLVIMFSFPLDLFVCRDVILLYLF